MGKIHSHFDYSNIFQMGLKFNHQLSRSACDLFGRLELIFLQFSPTLEAKDALKEATKEAAKKRKKEMQTATEDGKTPLLPPQIIHFNRVFHYFHHPFWGTPIFGNTQVLNERSESSNLIEQMICYLISPT